MTYATNIFNRNDLLVKYRYWEKINDVNVSIQNVTVEDGGNLFLGRGYIENLVIYDGGSALIDGYDHVYGNASVSNITVHSGGKIEISIYANVQGNNYNRKDGREYFSISSGIANNLFLNNAVSLTLSSGHIASNSLIAGHGTINILSGGATSGTILSSIQQSSVEFLHEAGAKAYGTTVSHSGCQSIRGGIAYDTIISSQGIQQVYSYGIASNTKIYAGGIQNIWKTSNASACKTIVYNEGRQIVTSEGVAEDAQILSGGEQELSASGYAIGTIVSSGGTAIVKSLATLENATILSGGVLGIYSPQYTIKNLNMSGICHVFNSGVTSDWVFTSGASQIVELGYAYGTHLDPYSEQIVKDAKVSGTVIGNLATQYLKGGYGRGSSISDTICNGGKQILQYGGVAFFTTVSNGGTQIIEGGGSAVSVDVLPGGTQILVSS